VLADLLAIDNGWTKKKYQAYKGGIQEEGHELWAELWNHERLQKRKREIGSFAFSSEFMNSPISDETAPIKESQIRYWKELPSQYSSVIAVDPAYSEDENADYKIASLILSDSQGNRYLGHYIRTHAKIGEFQDSILNMWLQHRGTTTAIGIPNSGVEKGFFDSFLKKCEERKLYPPIVELKNSFTQSGSSISITNKTARVVAALQPLFEMGKYYIGVDMLEVRDELMSIGVSKHDDLVDSLAYAEQLVQPYFADTIKQEGVVEIKSSNAGDYGYEDAYAVQN
jgi:phage terminase large subunit-like protein